MKHSKIFVKKLEVFKFCNTEFYEAIVEEYTPPYDMHPTKGKHDYKKCGACQDSLRIITNAIQLKYDLFPLCCPYHAKLTKAEWFKGSDFVNIPYKNAHKVIFANQHINNNHTNKDWYVDITNYLEYYFDSFGQFPSGFGEPLYCSMSTMYLTSMIENNTDLPIEKRNKLTDFIKKWIEPKDKKASDFNVLSEVYNKWIKTFPFELSFFAHLKPYFEKKVPLIDGDIVYNPYLKVGKGKLHTKSTLIEYLVNVTNDLLTQINVFTLNERGLISDSEKIHLELVIESRRQKLKQTYIYSIKDTSNRYRPMINEWFEDEKKFISELKSVIIHKGKVNNENKPLTMPQIALKYYYEGKPITRKNGRAIANLFGQTSGENLYQLYSKYSSRANRIGKESTRKRNLNKLELLETVISILQDPYKQRALDEMNTLKAAFEKEYN